MPVIRLVTVRPSVEKQASDFPVSFPYVAAMNAAAYSYLVTISLILEVLSEFKQVKVFFAWKSENISKPSSSSWATKRVRSFHESRLSSVNKFLRFFLMNFGFFFNIKLQSASALVSLTY